MPKNSDVNESDFRTHLEIAIRTLANEFLQTPYTFFTEADAVSHFQLLLENDPVINRKVESQDKFVTDLVHREYPTFFRFSDKNPTTRLGSPASRGHYDTVILNPEFVAAHPIEVVTNRNISAKRDRAIPPFRAVIEFKLEHIGWSTGSSMGVIAELGKLRLSEEAPLRYFVVLMRYTAPTDARWEKYWPKVKEAAIQNPEIGNLFAIWGRRAKKEAQIFRYGCWSQSDKVSSQSRPADC
ncbi:MAG: hypothetical protein JXA21_00970 [Anaerolineae bacterium]|nr:hypothetical protein [Anaerolineae bacterium]